MWEFDYSFGILPPIVVQDRNIHSLMKDFMDEWECYVQVKPLVNALESIEFSSETIGDALIEAYEALVENGSIDSRELGLLSAWSNDCRHTLRP